VLMTAEVNIDLPVPADPWSQRKDRPFISNQSRKVSDSKSQFPRPWRRCFSLET